MIFICIKRIKRKSRYLSTDHVTRYPGVEGPWKQGDEKHDICVMLKVHIDIWIHVAVLSVHIVSYITYSIFPCSRRFIRTIFQCSAYIATHCFGRQERITAFNLKIQILLWNWLWGSPLQLNFFKHWVKYSAKEIYTKKCKDKAPCSGGGSCGGLHRKSTFSIYTHQNSCQSASLDLAII